MKFAANLGFLFVRETANLIERIQLAGAAGFRGVEYPYPYDVPVSNLAAAHKTAGVELVLINSWPGNRESGDFGIAVHPDRRDEFREKLELSAQYLKVQTFSMFSCGVVLRFMIKVYNFQLSCGTACG